MKVLDLFCGAGGAAEGYRRAWPDADITGVDIRPMPRYPFRFVQADAMAFPLDGYDFIHASPPCQQYSRMRNVKGRDMRGYPALVDAIRTRLERAGAPWIMENVEGAPLRSPVTLCGLMFGLRVFRHRYFELGGWTMPQPPMPSHKGHRVSGWRHGVKYEGDMLAVYGDGGGKATVEECREGLGIDWSWDRDQLVESVPPAYTEFIGRALLEHVTPRWACSSCDGRPTLRPGEESCCGAGAYRVDGSAA